MDELKLPGEIPRGTPIAGYKIRQRIGAGATGTVYSAVHPINGRKVAVKVIHAHLSQHGDEARRFEEHSARLASLNHSGIVPVLEVGHLESDGRLYIVSEFALGQSLTDLLGSSGPLGFDEAQPLLEALTLILATLHGHELVHGGLTPDNIWITPREDGRWPPLVRVMDFGVSALRPLAGVEAESPYYLAPEQCRGERATVATDVYAFGVVAYQMLTGRLPFSSIKPAEVLRMHQHEAPRPPSEVAPGAADAWVLRALAKDPGERFQTMIELRQALRSPSLEGEIHTAAAAETSSAASEAVPAAEPHTAIEAGAATEPPPTVAAPAPPTVAAPAPPSLTRLDGRPGPTDGLQRAGPAGEVEIDAAPAVAPPAEIEDDAAAVVMEIEAAPRVEAATVEPRLGRDLLVATEAEAARAGGVPTPERVTITGVLPRLGRRSLFGPFVSGLLGVAVAVAAGVGAYRLIVGHWPWASAANAPSEGRIIINTTPPGATVYLDNVSQAQRTPLTLHHIQRGQPYELLVHLPGYAPWRETVALGLTEEERHLRLTLSEGPPRWGTLLLGASDKADFFLDTRKVGTQTRQVTLAEVRAGVEHQLRVVAPGYEEVQQRVRVEAGKVQVLQFNLQRQDRKRQGPGQE
jgi:tRNA A-37 threonylcarbamoyl transferase component Bud32